MLSKLGKRLGLVAIGFHHLAERRVGADGAPQLRFKIVLRRANLGEVEHVVHSVAVIVVGMDTDVGAAGLVDLRRFDRRAAEHPGERHRQFALAALIERFDVVEALALPVGV
jgi:hypothetical protein